MHLDAERLVRKYQIRQATLEAFRTDDHVAAGVVAGDFTPRVLETLVDAFLPDGPVRVAGLRERLRQIVDFVKRAPKAWEKIKDFLGIKSITDAPKVFKEWARNGISALRKVVGRITQTFPLSLYFVPKGKMPGLTDLLRRIAGSSPALEKMLRGLSTNIIQPLDRLMKKYIPNLSRPLTAAIFIWIWLNVAEITWAADDLLKGFTGAISLSELFSSLPESGIGAILAMLGFGYHLLPVTIIARLLWLVAHKYIEWTGKGFKVHWDRMGLSGQRPEFVPAA